MEALSLLNLQPQQQPRRRLFQLDHRRQHQKSLDDNTVSFSHRICSRSLCSSSLRTQSSFHFSSIREAKNIVNDSLIPKTLNPCALSAAVLKLPLSVLVAAAALFLSRFSLRCQPAFAEPPPATSSPAADTGIDVTVEDAAVPKDEINDKNKKDAVVVSVQKDEGDLKQKDHHNQKMDVSLIKNDVKALEAHLTVHPEDTDALEALLDIKISRKQYSDSEVLDLISKLIKWKPEEELSLRSLRGHIYLCKGEFDLAKSEFDLVLEEDPTYVEALHGLLMRVSQSPQIGDVRKEVREIEQQVQEAIEICETEDMRPLLKELKLLSAQICVQEGEYAAAMRVYRELSREEPDDFRPYMCQGVVYSMLQRNKEAERLFEECRKRMPEDDPYVQYFEKDVMRFVQQFNGGGGGGGVPGMGKNRRNALGSGRRR